MVKRVDALTIAYFKKPFQCLARQRATTLRKAYKRQQEKRKKECFARLMPDIGHEHGHQEETLTSSLFKKKKHRDLNGLEDEMGS
ncbi:LOW QUALITY PROTEIN: Asparagine synthase [Phytophthora palmivora]|uniref:Asparagine synthase n=1 Tax=Phytophthora palmivora TaxID=4796 RepID=A0A2P4YL49_9STRA|nr:LOW QUALITY PROTEIN: Asparagine synthase [Phytophthora palmivora]